MDEELECEICMENLIDSRALPCGHSFCEKCKLDLLQFNDNGSAILNCPNQCEEVTNIRKDQTLDDVLRKHFTMERLLAMHNEKINTKANREKTNCQGANAHEASPSCYCRQCRKLFCKGCLDEHECERNDHIKISFDAPKQCFLPICEVHNLLAKFICKQCNNDFLCVYCKNRTHRNHEITDLDSQLRTLKAEINAKLEGAKKLSEQIKQSDDSIWEKLEKFRDELSKELLLRKHIKLSKCFTQLNEEESNILKEFDEHVTNFVAQRKQMANSCDEVKKLLEDREEISNLLMMSEQHLLLERLKGLSKQLSLKVVLSERTSENHLGQLHVDVQKEETSNDTCRAKTSLSDRNDRVIDCRVDSKEVIEMTHETSFSDLQKFIDEIKRKFSFKDTRTETDNRKVHSALKTPQIRNQELDTLLKSFVNDRNWFFLKLFDFSRYDVTSILDEEKALTKVAEDGDVECMKLLLENNCDVDIKDNSGRTALLWASRNGHIECMKLLLENNCDVDIKSYSGYTALIWASRNGHIECMKLLLENNCDVDIKGHSGYTALMWASMCGKVECMKLLLENNCDVDVKDNRGRTAFMLASRRVRIKFAELLSKRKR